MKVADFAFKLFRNYYARRRHKYDSLRRSLIGANMFIPVERWLSLALFYSIIAPIILIIIFLFIKIILLFKIDKTMFYELSKKISFHMENIREYISNLPHNIHNLPNDVLTWMDIIKQYLISTSSFIYQTITIKFTISTLDLLLIALLIILTPILTYRAFFVYPKIRAWERKRKIEGVLYHAINYISSMSAAGIPPYEVFKRLSKAEDIYGEVSIEVKKVIRDVELLGYDFLSALKNLATTTPSDGFRAFIQGAITTAYSGGEIRDYFVSKAKEFLQHSKKKYEDFITNLGMIAEIYVVGLVAAPLFIIVLYTAMLMLKGASPLILFFVVYGIIPIGSIVFMLIIETITPEVAR